MKSDDINQEAELLLIGEEWCDVVGQPLQHLTEQALVQLWQPSFSTTEEVLAWQQLLVKRQIVQPFAQAFRDMDVVAATAETSTDPSIVQQIQVA